MYLATINIKNYKGVSSLSINFDPKLNIIIGENGCRKTAIIDAIRLMYNLGNQKKDILQEVHCQKYIMENYIGLTIYQLLF
ncbi:AAA family ATPase [Flavobacterium algoritolerans]|uniref:AAA family ATPase n=1 Tax=Flavobacterium algoritolerans TaxID=3041254 RepID=UPI003D15AB8E